MSLERIPPELIKTKAGSSAFEWAQQAQTDAVLKAFQTSSHKASAHIDGYNTEIYFHNGNLGGHCNCEESDGFDFCRHCALLAMHSNLSQQHIRSLARGPEKSRIMAYLLSLDKQALAKQCLQLIEQDPEQVQTYLLKTQIEGPEIDFAELRRELTRITRISEKLFSQRQVKHYFARIERFLSALTHADTGTEAERFLKLVEYAWQRVSAVLDQVDDTSGQRSECVAHLNHLYQTSFRQFEGRAATRAKRLLKFWFEDRHGLLTITPGDLLESSELVVFKTEAMKALESDSDLLQAVRKRTARLLVDDPDLDLAKRQNLRTILAEADGDWIRIAELWQEADKRENALQTLESYFPRCKPGNRPTLIQALLQCCQNKEEQLQRLQELFAQFPIDSAPFLLDALDDTDVSPSARETLLDNCIQLLKHQAHPDASTLLAELLLKLDRIDEILALPVLHELPLELRLRLISRLDSSPHVSARIRLIEKAIQELLGQERHKSDQQAAELLYQLQSEKNGQNIEAFLQSIRELLQSRPNFLKIVRDINRSTATQASSSSH